MCSAQGHLTRSWTRSDGLRYPPWLLRRFSDSVDMEDGIARLEWRLRSCSKALEEEREKHVGTVLRKVVL